MSNQIHRKQIKRIKRAVNHDPQLFKYGVRFVRFERASPHAKVHYERNGVPASVGCSNTPNCDGKTFASIIVQSIRNRCRDADNGIS